MSLEPDRPDVADLSVALCTRNGSRFVADQVRSILEQVPRPRELVVGDDASTDGTVDVIRATVAAHNAARPDAPVSLRVVQHDVPLGVVRNFQETIRACVGSLVALSDQDDLWPAGRLARMVPLFDDPAVLLVHTDARLVDGAGVDSGVRLLEALEASPGEQHELVGGDAFSVLLRRNLVTGATVVLRRSFAARAMPFPDSWVHDEWLAIVAAADEGLRLIPEPWLDYRQHDGNVIGASRVTWARRWSRLREPRVERAPRLVARARALAERLESHGADERHQRLARAKLRHEESRMALPAWQPLRVPGVTLGLIAGRYHRFSRGPIDVLRDLVQPASGSAKR